MIDEIYNEVSRLACEYCIPKTNFAPHKGAEVCAPHMLKYVLMKLCLDSGVRILFHTSLIGTDAANGKIEHIIISEKSGLAVVISKMFIDANGDGELMAFAYRLRSRSLGGTFGKRT